MIVTSILAFRFVTADLDRLAAFYAGLDFTVGKAELIPDEEMALLDLPGGGARLPLRLGEQRLDLDVFEHRGAP